MNTKQISATGILLMIMLCLLGILLFDTIAQQNRNESSHPMIIRVDKHNAVNADHICNYYIETTGTDTAKLYADLTNGTRVKLCTGTPEQCEAYLDQIVAAITQKLMYHQLF